MRPFGPAIWKSATSEQPWSMAIKSSWLLICCWSNSFVDCGVIGLRIPVEDGDVALDGDGIVSTEGGDAGEGAIEKDPGKVPSIDENEKSNGEPGSDCGVGAKEFCAEDDAKFSAGHDICMHCGSNRFESDKLECKGSERSLCPACVVSESKAMDALSSFIKASREGQLSDDVLGEVDESGVWLAILRNSGGTEPTATFMSPLSAVGNANPSNEVERALVGGHSGTSGMHGNEGSTAGLTLEAVSEHDDTDVGEQCLG